MILFHHKRNIGLNKHWDSCIEALGGSTIAIEQLKPWVLETLEVGDFFEKKIGISVCSPKDRYNKKIGRELAKSRMKPTKLFVNKIVKESNYIMVELHSAEDGVFIFKKYKSAAEPFFVEHIE